MVHVVSKQDSQWSMHLGWLSCNKMKRSFSWHVNSSSFKFNMLLPTPSIIIAPYSTFATFFIGFATPSISSKDFEWHCKGCFQFWIKVLFPDNYEELKSTLPGTISSICDESHLLVIVKHEENDMAIHWAGKVIAQKSDLLKVVCFGNYQTADYLLKDYFFSTPKVCCVHCVESKNVKRIIICTC